MRREGAEVEAIAGRVRLPGSSIEVSRLGLGTAALMSRVNRRDSVRLLETALGCGITHFDTARSYGFGEAELAVGDVLGGRRDRVTVTTKVGILPPRRSAGLRAAKALSRGVLRLLPGMRAAVRRSAGTLVQAGRFDERTMSESLHASLLAMRTDYVDFLLLHEPSIEVLATGEPHAFLERVKLEGKVRAFGIAAESEQITWALRHAPRYARAVQFPHSVFSPCSEWLRNHMPKTVFTHSSIGIAGAELRTAFQKDDLIRCRWADELDMDLTAPGALEGALLRYSMQSVPDGVVLFSSTREAHIRENAAALRTAASLEQLRRLERLAHSWNRARRRT